MIRPNRCSEYRTDYRMRLFNIATATNKSFTLTTHTLCKRQTQSAPTKLHDHNKLSTLPNIRITLTFNTAPPIFNLHCSLQLFCIDLFCFVTFYQRFFHFFCFFSLDRMNGKLQLNWSDYNYCNPFMKWTFNVRAQLVVLIKMYSYYFSFSMVCYPVFDR